MTTYRMVEVVGVSDKSYEEAIKSAISDAKSSLQDSQQALEGEGWFQVIDQRGRLDNGEITEFQIRLNVSFSLKK